MQQLGDVAQAQAEFERWLERQPLADRTKREYARNVRRFLEWLADGDGWDADPLTDRLARDHAARLAFFIGVLSGYLDALRRM